MAARRDVFSWLDGPGGAGGTAGTEQAYPGERLGRPQQGPGSVGRFGRRLVGVLIDWVLALVIANGLMKPLGLGSFAPLLVFLAENVLLVGAAGATLGHGVVGLRVERLAGGPPGPALAAARGLLLALGVPAVIWDADQRGLHDKAAGTLVVRR